MSAVVKLSGATILFNQQLLDVITFNFHRIKLYKQYLKNVKQLKLTYVNIFEV